MKWYLSLSIHKRITLKTMCIDICGVDFSNLNSILGLKDTIETIYQKLKIEGFLI